MSQEATPEAGVEEVRLGHIRIFLKPTLGDVEAARSLLNFYEKRLRGKTGGEFACSICGAVLGSERGLKLHRTRKHK